jgi:hypothetical protein
VKGPEALPERQRFRHAAVSERADHEGEGTREGEGTMFATGWCGGMSAAGWLLMAGLWAGFLAVVVWAVLRLFPRGSGAR